jgi:hypothetical protein
MGNNNSGAISCGNYVQTGGTLDMSTGTGNGVINCVGTFNQTGGIIRETGNGATNQINLNGSVTQTLNFAGTISNTINYTFNNPNGFTLTGSVPVNQDATVTRTNGAFGGGGTFTYNAINSNLLYNNAAALIAANEWPTVNSPVNVTLNGVGGVSLNGNKTIPVTGTLTLTLGRLTLGGTNSLTVLNAAPGAIAGTFSSNNMIVTSGTTDQLLRAIPNLAASTAYIFPVGETTGITQYSPITLNFSSNSALQNFGVRVVDATAPNLNVPSPPSDYLTRYWAATVSGASNYTYTAALTYVPGVEDVVGTESDLKVSASTGAAWTAFGTSVVPPTLTSGAGEMTQATASLSGGILTGRRFSLVPIYVWNGSVSDDWATANNWTPNTVPGVSDNVEIDLAGKPCRILSGAKTVNQLTLGSAGNLEVVSGGTLTISSLFTYSAGATTVFACGSTLNLNYSGSQTIPALSYGSLNIAGGNRALSFGTTNICNDYTPSAGITTAAVGSTVRFNGPGAQAIRTNPTTFYNLAIENTSGNYVTVAGGVTVANSLNIIQDARLDLMSTLDLTNPTSSATVDGYLRSAGLITGATAAKVTFGATGTYEHNWTDQPGTIPLAAWTHPGSTCSIIGYTTNTAAPTNIGQTFSNFRWNCANQTETVTLDISGTGNSILGDLNILSTGPETDEFRLFSGNSSASAALTIGGNTNISGGRLAVFGGGSNNDRNVTLNLNGNLTMTGGSLNLTSTNSGIVFIFGTGGHDIRVNLKGNLSIASPAQIIQSTGTFLTDFEARFIFNGVGTQTFNSSANGISTGTSIFWEIGTGVTTNAVVLASDFIAATSATSVTVKPNATLRCPDERVVSGASGGFDLNVGGTLEIGSAAGITTGTTAAGNIRTSGRTYRTGGNYTYIGTVNQATGNGLPATVTGAFSIANTAVTNNIVTLTTTPTTVTRLNLFQGRFAAGTTGTLNIASGGTLYGNGFTGGYTGNQLIGSTAGGIIQFVGPLTTTVFGEPELYNATISANGIVNFGGFSTLRARINNNLLINKTLNGAVPTNGPRYAVGSTLIYNSGAAYSRGAEWNQAIITPLDPGYPHHVTVQNVTTLNLGIVAASNLEMGGNLTLGNAAPNTVGSVNMNALTIPVKVIGNLIIGANTSGLSTFTMSSAAGGNLEVNGNYTRSAFGSFVDNATTGISFKGTGISTINATTGQTFNNLSFEKTGAPAITLNTPVRVTQSINFTGGIVGVSPTNTLTVSANALGSGGNSNSFVNGPLRKETDNTARGLIEFTFPIGKGASYQPAGVLPVSHVGTTTYKAEYFPASTVIAPNLNGSLTSLIAILGNKYWDISKETVNAATARVVMHYSQPPAFTDWRFVDPDGPVTAPLPSNTNVAVVHHGAGGWAFTKNNYDFNVLTAPLEAIYYQNTDRVYSGAMSSFSPFTVGFGSSIILPIKLISFEGRLLNNDGALTWKIADATELAGFELEYSSDGANFKKLADVAASSSTVYGYLDKQLPQGSRFYRLLIKEKNGNSLYSAVIMLTLDGQKTSIVGLASTIVSQPSVTGKIISAKPQGVRALVSDVSGKRVIEQKGHLQAGNNRWLINTGWLASGMYFVTIITDDEVKSTLQFVKE